MDTTRYQKWLNTVTEIVDRSGDIIRTHDRNPREIQKKGRNDLVTDTDVAVEQFLKTELSAAFPNTRFLAEESSGDAGLEDMTWIIDPVDGTTNFAHGIPFVATSVALWEKGRPVLGVINLPLMNELFTASLGGGSFLNNDRISVSQTESIADCVVATGFPYAINDHLKVILERLERVLPVVQGVRRPGAAALDLAFVACGRFDAFYESALNPWDTAAGVLLVTEAGGTVTESDGTTPYIPGAPEILATNGRVHQAVADLIAV